MQQKRKTGTAFVLLSMLASMALSTVGFVSFLFTLPLLLLRKRVLSTEKCVWVQAVTYITLVAYSLYPYIGFFQPENYGIIAFSTIFTLISALQALIFTAMEEKSSSLLRKLVVSGIPAFAIGGAFVAWITSPLGAQSIGGFKTVIETVVNDNMPEMLQIMSSDIILSALIILTVPMSMILSCIPILISELVLNSKEEEFQENLAYMKMPGKYSVFLLVSVIAIVLSYIVKDYPMWLTVLGWNFTLGLLLYFGVNGFSIFYGVLRRKSNSFTVGRAVLLLVCAALIPGINFGVFAGLCIIAILENWIKFR